MVMWKRTETTHSKANQFPDVQVKPPLAIQLAANYRHMRKPRRDKLLGKAGVPWSSFPS